MQVRDSQLCVRHNPRPTQPKVCCMVPFEWVVVSFVLARQCRKRFEMIRPPCLNPKPLNPKPLRPSGAANPGAWTGKEVCRIFTLWDYPESGPFQQEFPLQTNSPERAQQTACIIPQLSGALRYSHFETYASKHSDGKLGGPHIATSCHGLRLLLNIDVGCLTIFFLKPRYRLEPHGFLFALLTITE